MKESEIATGEPPTYEDVVKAAHRIAGVAVRTPLLESPLLNARVGRRVLVKPECLQRTGSFKFRGATNRIKALTEEEKAGGVVAFSSGNHAQGVAAAAKAAGTDALIVMPANAPSVKIENTKSYGAAVHLYDRLTQDRAAIAADLARQRNALLIPPFDDPYVIAGQGTVGLEIAEDAKELGIVPDAAVICTGGGGLTAGTTLALKHAFPEMPVFGAEPKGFDDTARSLASGQRETNAGDMRSICDAILSARPGVITFQINKALLDGVCVVDDAAVLRGMKVAFNDLKLVTEPGGAIALTAVLENKLPPGDGPVVAVISGGNVDAELFSRALAS